MKRNCRLEPLEERRMMTGDWRNPALAADVDASGYVSLTDALAIITYLRENGNPHPLQIPPQPPNAPPPYVDVDGNDTASVGDLLEVISPLRSGLGLPAPALQAALANDTPPDTMDGITSDATIAGQITANLMPGTHLTARVDQGAWVNVAFSQNGDFTFNPSLTQNGTHTVRFVAQTFGGPFTVADVDFEFTGGVTFDPVEALSVIAGRTIEAPLSAFSERGMVTFMLSSEMQLPPGRLRADGVLEFTPRPEDVGQYQFELIASDGQIEARQTVSLEVTADPVTTTRLSGRVLDTDSQPIVGLRVSIDDLEVLTDENGDFLIDVGSGGPFPADAMKFHGQELTGANAYPFVAEKIPLMLDHEAYLGVLNEIRRPVYLPVLDVAGGTQIDPNQNTTVSQEVAPGEVVEVLVAAGTLMDQQGGLYDGVLSITEVPPELTPAALPPELSPSLVVTIQPADMVFTVPAPLDFPNNGGWSPGVEMDLWSINPVTGVFDDVGDGVVSPDGTRIVTITGGVRNSSWHFFTAPPPVIAIANDEPACDICLTSGLFASEVRFGTGAVTEMHALPTYTSLGESRGVELVYDSLRADPRRIFHGSAEDVSPNIFSIPSTLRVVASASVNVNGVIVDAPGFSQPGQFGLRGGENFFTVPEGDGRLDAALMIDLTEQPSGLYPYTVQAGLRGFFTGVRFIGSSDRTDDLLVHVNGVDSPFGAGWSIAGLQRIVTGPDGSAAILNGDGNELLFRPIAGGLQSPPGDFSTLEKLPDGSYRRTMPDQMVYEFNPEGMLTVMRDRNGNETQYQYDPQGNLTKIIDPVLLETTLAYTDGKATSITDPAGRVTQLEYDADGNLMRIVDADNTSRQFEYDDRHHLIVETTRRGFQETSEYDEFGRAKRAERPDGSVVEITPLAVRGLYPAAETADPFNAPPAVRTGGESIYVSDSGNTIRTQLDVNGQVISERDDLGLLSGEQRDARNLVTQSTDARGNVATYTYDSRGNLLTVQDAIARQEGDDVLLRFEYDPDFSQLTRIIDELGREVLYEIDPANGNTLSITEVIGAVGGLDDLVTQFTYTAQGLLDTATDPLGRVTDYDYDTLGRLSSVTFALGTADEAARQFEYDAAGNLTAAIDELGNRTEFQYDPLNRLTKMIEADPDGAGPLTSPVTEFFYDAAGNLDRALDARGNETLYEYDSRDRLTQFTDPDLGVSQYEYDLAGNLIASIDPNDHETNYVYDVRNRPLETHDPDGGVTEMAYDVDDNPIEIIDPEENVTRFAYDARNRLTQETQVQPVSTPVYSNDFETAVGPEWSIDRLDRTPAGDRGFLGQFVHETETLTLTGLAPHDEVTVEFDLFIIGLWGGSQVTFNGFTTGPDVWDLSVAGGPTLLHTTFSSFASPDTTPCGPDQGPDLPQAYPGAFPGANNEAMTGATERKTLGYNTPNGECDPRSSVYHLSFTFPHTGSNLALNFSDLTVGDDSLWGLDNVTVTIQNPMAQYAYDLVDNLVQMTDRNNRVTQFAYDDLDRLTTETWVGGGNVVQYAYDKASNLASATDDFSALAFAYDNRDRVATVDNTGTPGVPPVVLTYAYDDANNVLSTADTIGGAAAGLNQYVYDALNRMTRISQSGVGVSDKRADIAYNPLGQFETLSRFADLAGTAAVVQSDYLYDALNRLDSLHHQKNGTDVAFFDFMYDAASRITQIEDIDGLTTYAYDDRDQLTGADHADAANPDENYEYDANGNRLSSHLHDSDYVTDTHNRLASDGVYDYAYDAEGNLILRTEIATGATREFAWDHRNRLTSVVDKDAAEQVLQTVEFTYDAFDRRISKSLTTATDEIITHFVYDGIDVLLDIVDADGAGPNAPQLAQRYLHGPAIDQVLSQDDGAGNVLWHLSDHLGTIHDLASSAGLIVNHLTYDTYGNVVEQTNSTVSTRYQFTGREFDEETKLRYYRARYYDSSTGRFVSEDPIGFAGGDVNLNAYANNDPIGRRDPLGLQNLDPNQGPLQGGTEENALRNYEQEVDWPGWFDKVKPLLEKVNKDAGEHFGKQKDQNSYAVTITYRIYPNGQICIVNGSSTGTFEKGNNYAKTVRNLIKRLNPHLNPKTKQNERPIPEFPKDTKKPYFERSATFSYPDQGYSATYGNDPQE